jgi:hypothetical protein
MHSGRRRVTFGWEIVVRTIASITVFCLCSMSLANAQAVFPNAVSSKYASEKPNIARMRTCLDQYMENKTTNGNGGLVWQHKGSGYYSECKKRLK